MPRNPPQQRLADEEYEAQLKRQNGHCALCPNTPKTRRLDQDHNHRTGEFRGLLCGTCNRVLGYIEKYGKSTDWMLSASGYRYYNGALLSPPVEKAVDS